jgi:putative transposase
MSTRKRQCAGNTVYHVINRANGKLMIFKKPSDFLAFERVLAQGLARTEMRLCGYCIMGNHWHMLLWPRNDGDLSTFMQWATMTHAKRWHTAHGTAGIGHLYQGRFKSFPVQATEYYLKTLQYIESNPLRAGLVEDSNTWQFSSLAIRNGMEKQGIKLHSGNVKLPDTWNTDVNIIPDEATEAKLQNCITRGTPFGGDRWARTVAQRLNLESTLSPRGRPKKNIPTS